MHTTPFKAFVVEEHDGTFSGSVQERCVSDLPGHDTLIKVRYSSLNYKDALSASGNRGVTKNYPHTPGIDAVGTVVSSASGAFSENDTVIVTSYDLGMNTPGGFGQYIRVPAEWVLKLPENMTAQEAMIIGTAGLTAGMSVLRLTEHIQPGAGPVIVSGATGGVGSLSVAILAKMGYDVAAVSGKSEDQDYLLKLGAAYVIERRHFEQQDKHPMLKALFAGGIDTVGGPVLENMIKSMQPMGVVTCCGNVASAALNLTVFPFILRGVSLIGIDSQNYPMTYRQAVWSKLAGDWKPRSLMDVYSEIGLDQLNETIERMLEGKLKGRIVVDVEG